MTRVLLIVFCMLLAVSASAGDLYKVQITGRSDALRLQAAGAEPIVRLNDGYLVLTDPPSEELLAESGLTFTRLATGITKNELALDNRLDRANTARYPLLYEEADLRLYRVTSPEFARGVTLDLVPIRNEGLTIDWPESSYLPVQNIAQALADHISLDSLVALVSQDSLTNYLLTLQSYPPRVAGSLANYLSRDWIASQFTAMGYDSVVIDSFTASINGVPKPCQNVLGYKVGTRFPNHHIIVGAHRDAVSGSPGADDNGSGSAAVLEIARALKDTPTDMTIIFALFDAEESGLLGSYAYVNDAAARGDSIVFMLNMDMIAHFESETTAKVYHGAATGFSNLWITLADSLVGITGTLTGASSGSDHYPFTQRGYEASFIHEGIFSTVYHSFRDSSSYMNFDYMTKMVKASLATIYVADATAGPTATLVFQYPSPLPIVIAPGLQTPFDVLIHPVYGAAVVPGSATLHYSINGASFVTAPLAAAGPDLYTVNLPATDCNARIRYYLSADEATYGTFYDTDPLFPHEVVVATSSASLFEDNFETNKGWTVSGNPLDGPWTRGVPQGQGQRGDPPTDFDGSGQCWLTDNVLGNSDVDDGYTFLTSPIIDLSTGNARIHAAIWYSNSFGAAPHEDVFRILVSNDDGANWVEALVLGPDFRADGGWFEYSFWVGDFVSPTSQMRLRFEASDISAGSVVEAAVDDIRITSFDCIPPSCCAGTTGNVNMTGIVDLADLSMLIAYLTASPPPELPCHDEANVNAVDIINLSDLSLLIAYLTMSPRPELPLCP